MGAKFRALAETRPIPEPEVKQEKESENKNEIVDEIPSLSVVHEVSELSSFEESKPESIAEDHENDKDFKIRDDKFSKLIIVKAKALQSYNKKISTLNKNLYYHKFVKNQRAVFD